MTGRILPGDYQFNSSDKDKEQALQNVQQAQDVIYKFLIKLVTNSPPDLVLQEFKSLFLYGDSTTGAEGVQALYKILFNNDEEEFKNTLKRSCYILINNWSSQRKYDYIQQLIQLFNEATEPHQTISESLKRLRAWVANFFNSQDYQDLKLFASPYLSQRGYWSYRYASYLLVPQYLDSKNPKEQRELARNLSKRLKEKYKLELAMYTARWKSTQSQDQEKELTNPTKLGDAVIRFIKTVISRSTLFDYTTQAHIFIQQTRELTYQDFKLSLRNYLCFSLSNQDSLEIFKSKLTEKLDSLYENYHEEKLTIDLLLRTSRRVIEWLTTEDNREPSYLFILLNTQGNTLPLTIVLLKIILICQYVRTHLEICVAQLISHYENYPEDECKWVINFLETFNLVFAIYAENVQFNLVQIKENSSESPMVAGLDSYRVFSQLKGADLRGNDLSGADLRNTDLSVADLRGVNLQGADLSQADLSLAKLSRAHMSNVILEGAELIAADLNRVNLSNAKMTDAKLRRASLQQASLNHAILSRANLNCSDLSGADLQQADLQYVDLSYSKIIHVNLSGANLQYANLSHTNLSHANLSGANLQNANLSGANLSGANLSGANLQYANLSNANLQDTNLTQSKLNRADLESVNLQRADLKEAIVRHTKLAHAQLNHATFNGADLSYAELRQGNLSGADLRDTLLRHANLSGADLSEANLIGANLFSTNLEGATIKNTQFGENSEFFEITPV